MCYMKEFQRWLENADADKDLIEELRKMNETQKKEAFYRNLTFGTGGLRGIIGAGTNRMNVYTVAKASQGLADYLKQRNGDISVVIGYDTRIKSDMFARVAAEVFAANNILVNIWDKPLPVPIVSYAVRNLKAAAGVMITASHNSAEYNGYKVYGADGCQITTEVAKKILVDINKLDIFSDVRVGDFIADVKAGRITYISDETLTDYINDIKKQSVLYGDKINKDVAIVYTPLNGTGLLPVTRVLRETGYSNITVVKEQEKPDGKFPTCPYPNPEIKEAMDLGIEYAKRCNADLLLATDPDCDRVGIAVKNNFGDFELLSANEVGLLLLDYICAQRLKHNNMPETPVMIKTIVTTDMGERIASYYGVETRNVLTGFKFIGEQIGFLEKENKEDRFIFGFEESYGYLSGSYVRDKDGVNASYLICEMFSYYKTRGKSFLDKLNELYTEYGYYFNTLHSYEFEGIEGVKKIQSIMTKLHKGVANIGSRKVLTVLDYLKGVEGLPKSDVLKYVLDNNCSIVIRPSGTEPKLKIYISVSGESREKAEIIESQIHEDFKSIMED